VQAAGDLIAAALAELGASMQGGHHYFQSGPLLLGVHINGYATTIVSDFDDIAGVDDQVDSVTLPSEDLINGIVNDLANDMMQTTDASVADVHSGMSAHGIQPFEYLNLFGGIAVLLGHKLLLPVKSVLCAATYIVSVVPAVLRQEKLLSITCKEGL